MRMRTQPARRFPLVVQNRESRRSKQQPVTHRAGSSWRHRSRCHKVSKVNSTINCRGTTLPCPWCWESAPRRELRCARPSLLKKGNFLACDQRFVLLLAVGYVQPRQLGGREYSEMPDERTQFHQHWGLTITLNLPLAAVNYSSKEQGPHDSCSLVLRLNPSIRLGKVRKGLLVHEIDSWDRRMYSHPLCVFYLCQMRHSPP